MNANRGVKLAEAAIAIDVDVDVDVDVDERRYVFASGEATQDIE